MLSAMKEGGLDTDKAFAFGDCFVHHLTFEQFTAIAASGAELSPDLLQAVQGASGACR
jgi:hypothetical protein